MKHDYAYSFDGESFHERYGSREDALAAGREEYYEREGEHIGIVTGRVVEAVDLLPKIDFADYIEERAEEVLHDEIGYDDQIIELSKEARDRLNDLIHEFLVNNATFNAYGIADYQEHPPLEEAA